MDRVHRNMDRVPGPKNTIENNKKIKGEKWKKKFHSNISNDNGDWTVVEFNLAWKRDFKMDSHGRSAQASHFLESRVDDVDHN